MNKIKVLLADDHTVVRQGLRSLLAAEPDIEVVGEAENGRQAVQMAKTLAPDVGCTITRVRRDNGAVTGEVLTPG